MDAHQRLVEWGEEKHYPGWDIPMPTGGALGRMLDVAHDERIRRRLGVAARVRRGLRKLGIKLPRGHKPQVVACKESRVGRMDILTHRGESFPSPPDGGLGAMVERMAGSIERSRRCRQVGELVDLMPEDMRTLVRVTFGDCPNPNAVPRPAKAAADLMGISERTYWRRKGEMLEWLSERLGLRSAAAA